MAINSLMMMFLASEPDNLQDKMESVLDRSDLRSPGEAGLDEEMKMERMVQNKVDAIENVLETLYYESSDSELQIVVAGSERKYLVCIFTLGCDPNSNVLSDRSLKFMRDCGSSCSCSHCAELD